MTRHVPLLVLAGLLGASTSRAEVDVAPPPREIRPDGTREPAPNPEVAKKENPLEVVQRIIQNSKAVGDKLAGTDTGTETRGTQQTILKDIQSLIDQQDDPPPPKPDQNPDKDKNDQPKDKDDGNKKDTPPMGGMKDMPPMKDMGMGGKDEKGDQPMGRRPRQKNGDEPMGKNSQPKDPSGKNQQPKPNPNQPPKESKGGMLPDPSPGDSSPGRKLLPHEDDVVKDVWGHLPDKLRQQATQYFQQDFMPRYTELLKLYYSSLAEKGGKK